MLDRELNDLPFIREGYVHDLRRLHELIIARQKAHERRVPLHAILVRGQAMLSKSGAVHVMSVQADGTSCHPSVRFTDLPPAVSMVDFGNTWLAKLRQKHQKIALRFARIGRQPGQYGIGPVDEMCPICRRGWTIQNAFDCVVYEGDALVRRHTGCDYGAGGHGD